MDGGPYTYPRVVYTTMVTPVSPWPLARAQVRLEKSGSKKNDPSPPLQSRMLYQSTTNPQSTTNYLLHRSSLPRYSWASTLTEEPEFLLGRKFFTVWGSSKFAKDVGDCRRSWREAHCLFDWFQAGGHEEERYVCHRETLTYGILTASVPASNLSTLL